ncbi:unnamed protein product [Rhodiola kirilowii]
MQSGPDQVTFHVSPNTSELALEMLLLNHENEAYSVPNHSSFQFSSENQTVVVSPNTTYKLFTADHLCRSDFNPDSVTGREPCIVSTTLSFQAEVRMASLTWLLPSTISNPQIKSKSFKLPPKYIRSHIKILPVCCTKSSPWEPSPVTYTPLDEADNKFLEKTANIFETMSSEDAVEAPVVKKDETAETKSKPPKSSVQILKWPLWILGPSLLLTTGMVPTLWLPMSSIFIGPNIASLLSLVGLDCMFNIGATLFLLMADACARPRNPKESCNSRAPFSYRFWNMLASLTGFLIPLALVYASRNGILQPHLPFIPFAILLGPYLLLLSVQVLTEMLTWHWQSPIWLVTPVVYEAYRILQLMRALKLGAELTAPAWMMHTVRGLVCWWVLILGVQLMRVAWYAGFSARATQPKPILAATK